MLNRCIAVVLLGLSAAGCGGRLAEPVPSGVEPVGLQMLRTEAQLSSYPFFTLLSFERDADSIFVDAQGGQAAVSSTTAHTGIRSMELTAGTRVADVKLSSLHGGRPFPGPWTLLGAYFHTRQPQRMTIAYLVGGQACASYTVRLPAGRWTPVLLDTYGLARDGDSVGVLRFEFAGGLAAPVLMDDVVEINNKTQLLEVQGFRITEAGFRFIVEGDGFGYELPTPEASSAGWRLLEANPVRVRFGSMRSKNQRTTYSDGRDFQDGQFRMLADGGDLQVLNRQHLTPAEIAVPPELGRLERNSSGDLNNDGYDEKRGTYLVLASGPRLEFTLTPRTEKVANPVMEITGLPPGTVLATMEGRLVEKAVRLPDGKVLMQLPGTLQKATGVTVKVSR